MRNGKQDVKPERPKSGKVAREVKEASQPASAKPSSQANPTRWWQWVLVYPGLAVALLAGVPTYVEAFKSYRLGVPFGRSADAQEQNRLWQENFECTQKAKFTMIRNKKNVEIGSVVCGSGDILLRGKRPEWDRPQARWVSWNDVAPSEKSGQKTLAGISLISSAHAAEPPPKLILAQWPGSVVCQRWIGPGQLLQRIGTPQGCFDQVINTYNGWILGSRPAPCARNC